MAAYALSGARCARCPLVEHETDLGWILKRGSDTSRNVVANSRVFSASGVGSPSRSPEQYYCYKFRGFWIPVALPPAAIPEEPGEGRALTGEC